jgi:hypothetical protein
MKTLSHLWEYFVEFFLEWEMFSIKFVEKIKTHILYSIIFFFESCAVYEVMSKNMMEPERPQVTI